MRSAVTLFVRLQQLPETRVSLRMKNKSDHDRWAFPNCARRSAATVRTSSSLRSAIFISFLLFSSFMPTPLPAQVAAAISGRVVDPSGAAVGGVNVSVKSLETGATRTVTTDDGGNFRLLSLPVGPQELKVEK